MIYECWTTLYEKKEENVKSRNAIVTRIYLMSDTIRYVHKISNTFHLKHVVHASSGIVSPVLSPLLQFRRRGHLARRVPGEQCRHGA